MHWGSKLILGFFCFFVCLFCFVVVHLFLCSLIVLCCRFFIINFLFFKLFLSSLYRLTLLSISIVFVVTCTKIYI